MLTCSLLAYRPKRLCDVNVVFAFAVTSVKLSVDNYMVVESEGSVEVCVERIGDSTENTTVTIIARESSPADATG